MAQSDANRKGKPINSSVPSFRFNANAEEIEELYATDEEHDELALDPPSKAASDVEGSPSKSNKFGKRSTSVDVSSVDLSPPTDPWRFFSDIKGKITKSVEGKITEYKSQRAGEIEASPKKSSKCAGKECKDLKDGKEKESSSLSESEELSESSLSRTCGIVSTTEGVEMSSDDDNNPSLSDKRDSEKEAGRASANKSSFRHSHKLKRNVTIVAKDGSEETRTTNNAFLEDLRNINMGLEVEQSDIEDGIDALSQIDNFKLENENINITRISGEDIRLGFFNESNTHERTVYSPTGFVDLREPPEDETYYAYLWRHRFYCFVLIGLIVYVVLPVSNYTHGFIAGSCVMLGLGYIYVNITADSSQPFDWGSKPRIFPDKSSTITTDHVPIIPVKEERPTLKYQGWANEYPEAYDPYTYHISQTQSVYLRLQGNLLKISNTKSKIPKRATYNELEHKMGFTRHRIYNLLGAEVVLLPVGLTKIRHWSKKYPICIILNKDQFCYDIHERKGSRDKDTSKESVNNGTQVFSKLIEDSSINIEVESSIGSLEEQSSIKQEEVSNTAMNASLDDMSGNIDDDMVEEEISFFDTTDTIDPQMDNTLMHDTVDNTCIYLFARTDREKEHWFRRFKRATHRLGQIDTGSQDSASDIVKNDCHYYSKYLKIMSPMLTPIESGGTFSTFIFIPSTRLSDSSIRSRRSRLSIDMDECNQSAADLHWLNSLIYRIAFDFHQSEHVIKMIQDRIAKKLAAIKLPIFIESLRMTELTFGNYAPKICKIGKPHLDEWGLWTDFEISYEGSVIIMVLTKLNLLKLKQQGEHRNGESSSVHSKSAIYNSDVEDTAESSSDDDHVRAATTQPLDEYGHPVSGLGGVSKQNKKFMNMVDRFAESKFFQRATENKYIKKAIEGVSNTDVGLKLEVKAIKGCLVVNIPPPPSDRIWFGFRSVPMPKLQLTAQPIVGERNWNFIKVSNWIEKRVYKEFLKVMLLPNMEDILVPGMDPRLPE